MKIAILMVVHKNFEQVKKYASQFDEELYDIYIHVDKKCVEPFLVFKKNIHIIPKEMSIDVRWGEASIIDAYLVLMKYSYNIEYSHYLITSGQDLLIKKSSDLHEYINRSKNLNFVSFCKDNTKKYRKRNEIKYYPFMLKNSFFSKSVRNIIEFLTGGKKHTFSIFKRKFPAEHKPYFGAGWFCFSGEFVHYMINFLEKEKMYIRFFDYSSCGDECALITILMNSPYKDKVCDYPIYVDWSEGKRNPKILTQKDISKLEESNCYIARKFDVNVDSNVVEYFVEKTKEK